MATLLLLVVMLVDEFWPMAVLKLPAVRLDKLSEPTATLHAFELSALINMLFLL